MKPWIAATLMAMAPLGAAGAVENSTLAAPSVDVLAWPRMSSPAFGCYMEKALKHRDARFNCSLKGYRNQGDVCQKPDAYEEGPAFPASLASAVHPQATRVELSWEHGDLQAVSITLKGTWSEADVRRAFHLPRAAAFQLSVAEQKAHAWPQNIMDTDVQYPTPGETAVTLTGFDHTGAGDVGCDGSGG